MLAIQENYDEIPWHTLTGKNGDLQNPGAGGKPPAVQLFHRRHIFAAAGSAKRLFEVQNPMQKPSVIYIGPFPKPVHGQSLATERLYALLTDNGIAVQAVDTGESAGGFLGKCTRVIRLCKSLWFAARDADWLYISVNSGKGLVFSELQARLGRRYQKRLILHHHVYRYIGEYDEAMAKLADTAGSEAIHLTNCDDMAELLKARYSGVGEALGYGNAGFVDPKLMELPTKEGAADTISLGHMSNLTVDKGVGRAIATFEAALEKGLNVTLLLAGPYGDPEARTLVENASCKHSERIKYLGPVYGDEKTEFFAKLDVFLFPTRYKNEAGPIVVLEAMAAGVPTISTDQCCIPSMLSDGGGLSLKMNDPDFIKLSIEYLEHYMVDPAGASSGARRRYRNLLSEQKVREQQLLTLLSSN